MKLTLGLYGLFLLLAAVKGNGGTLITDLQTDMPGFLPWLVAAAALGLLYEFQATHGVAEAFILLAILTFVLTNFNELKQQFGEIYSGATGATTVTPAATTSSTAGDADFGGGGTVTTTPNTAAVGIGVAP